MRIIAGSAKGRRIKAPKKGSDIYPILGRVRQSLFDTIRPKITGSYFLDLYAGTGMVGIEAISRGAQMAAFVDKGREALKLIERNLKTLAITDKSVIMEGDIMGGALVLLRLKLSPEVLFDLVFCAPPYLGRDRRGDVLVMSVPTLHKLAASRLLAKDAWVILQHHQKEPMEGMPAAFETIKSVKFGESILRYLQWRGTRGQE
ncbi:MAG: RsmD family RNA methyltransferase [Elusimicrobia bacterium]|nr:RsmD family RNA methyltransferase [Elusimicrobiota bacterium]